MVKSNVSGLPFLKQKIQTKCNKNRLMTKNVKILVSTSVFTFIEIHKRPVNHAVTTRSWIVAGEVPIA